MKFYCTGDTISIDYPTAHKSYTSHTFTTNLLLRNWDKRIKNTVLFKWYHKNGLSNIIPIPLLLRRQRLLNIIYLRIIPVDLVTGATVYVQVHKFQLLIILSVSYRNTLSLTYLYSQVG